MGQAESVQEFAESLVGCPMWIFRVWLFLLFIVNFQVKELQVIFKMWKNVLLVESNKKGKNDDKCWAFIIMLKSV